MDFLLSLAGASVAVTVGAVVIFIDAVRHLSGGLCFVAFPVGVALTMKIYMVRSDNVASSAFWSAARVIGEFLVVLSLWGGGVYLYQHHGAV